MKSAQAVPRSVSQRPCAIQRGAYPNLRIIALADPVVSRKLALVVRRNAHLSPAAQALYDMILKQAGSVRGENG